MLNLPEFEVVKREENEYYYKFTIIAKYRPFVCTQCLWDEVSRIKREFRGCTRQPRWGKDKEKYFEKLNHVKKICLSLKP